MLPTTSPLEYAFEDVQLIIKRLMRLSIALNRPAARDFTAKSSKIEVHHFAKWDDQYIIDKVAALSVVSTTTNSTESPSRTETVCPEYLIRRLAKANTERRQLIRYFQQHHQRIAKGDSTDDFFDE